MRKQYEIYQSIQSEQLPSQNKMYDNVSQMRSSLCHINPINRHKYRNDGSKQKSTSKSAVRVIKNSEQSLGQKINSEIGQYLKVDASRCKTYETEMHSSVFEQIAQLLTRIQNNQKQIEKLKKYGLNNSPSAKIQRDFRQIKDIYMIIKDQKLYQAETNKRITEEVSNMKKMLNSFKQQLEISNKRCECYEGKVNILIKQVEQKVLIEINNKWKSFNWNLNSMEWEQKWNQSLKELRNTKIELMSKIGEIQHKNSENRVHAVKHFLKAGWKCQSDKLIQIHVRESIGTGGNSHKLSEFVYYVDKNGHLLDQDHYYLLDDHNQMIKVFDEHLLCIKQNLSLIS